MAEIEKELKEGVAYFEQILDVLPGDRTALEFLCVACAQMGDTEKFLKHAIALSEVVLREKSAESATDLIEKLKTSEDPRAQAAVLKLQVLLAPKPDLTFERPEERLTSAKPAIAAAAERALLDKLVSEGVLKASLVRAAYDQLEHLPTTGGDFLISALAILEKENLTGAVDAVVAVADAAHAPPLPLDSFDIVPGLVRRLPDELVKVRGAIAFAKLCDEWAVAVLNPLDEELKREISMELGAKCHFFLAHPGTVERVLERVFKSEEEGEANVLPVRPVPAPEPPPVEVPSVSASEPPPAPSPLGGLTQ